MTDLVISIVIAVLIVVAVIYSYRHFKGRTGCCGGGTDYVSKKKLKNIAAKKVIVIDGMTCEKCRARVERYLNDLDGVAAKANISKKQAVVSMEKLYTDEQLTAAVEKAGFRVISIK